MGIVWFIIIGGIAGWLAGLIMKGRGFGLIGNIVVGVIGAMIGGLLLSSLGAIFQSIGPLVTATIGAIVLLLAISFIKRV